MGLGYESGFLGRVSLSRRELGHHGAVFGAPGSGKTTTLSLLVQGHSTYGPNIVLDGKGSRAMQDAIRAAGGLVWTIGGPLKLDLLDPDPTVLAEQLTEASRHEGPPEVYSEAAARAIQWAGHVLAWRGITPTLEAVERLLTPGVLAQELDAFKGKPRVSQWLAEMADIGEVELSGVRTALMRTTRLLDSAAGPSLGAGVDAVRLEDVVQGRTTLLLSLDSRRYPGLVKVLGGWALVALQRACAAVPKGTSCMMVVDEIGAFGKQARHIEPLLARARDAGVGVVVAAHGLTQLNSAVHGLGSQVLQETAWQVVLAQGDPTDADELSRLFPLRTDERVTLGKVATGIPTVTRDTLMWLAVGDCAFRVRPVDGLNGRWGMARVAMPRYIELPVRLALPAPASASVDAHGGVAGESSSDLTATYKGATEASATTEAEMKDMVYSKVRVVDGWRRWEGGTVDPKSDYPRVWIPRWRWVDVEGQWKWQGRHEFVHRLVYVWEQGPIQKTWTVDHRCGLKRCLDCLEQVTVAENTKRRHEREGGARPTGHVGMVSPARPGADVNAT